MTTKIRLQLALLCLASLCSLGLTWVQSRPKIPPPDFKRETEVDEAGQTKWKPFEVECPNCKGSKNQVCEHCKDSAVPICMECEGNKRTTCRPCGGKGKLPDPLIELACPYCWGSSWYVCGLCNSFGFLSIDNNETKCGACKQKGLLKCSACEGKRRVETIKVGKKNLGDAAAKDLTETLAKLKTALTALEKYEPDANPSRSAKNFDKLLEPLERDLKAIKGMQTLREDILKGIKSYGAGLSGFEDRLIHQFLVFRDRTVYLLQHQIRAVEQSLERATSNETK